jgi:methylmalonyl-CoA/ethylmalonyl-CoA epimerase
MIRGIHHIGIVVSSLEGALPFFRDVLGLPVAKTARVRAQSVRAALLPLPSDAAGLRSELELLEPIEPESGIGRFLERRGEGLHHVCFQTDDIDAELAGLKARGVELIDQEPRWGLAGRIFFCHPRAHHGTLVELAQPVEGRDIPGVEFEDGGGRPPGGRSSPLLLGLDHLVLAVRDSGAATRVWEANLGLKADDPFQPQGAGFGLVRVPVGDGGRGEAPFLELVVPLAPDHRVARFIEERGEGMFSISCRVERLDETVAYLREKGATVSEPEPGVFEGTRVACINGDSAHGVALQLVERQ